MAVWPRTHRVVIGVQNGGIRYIRVTHYTVALWDIGKSPPASAKIARAVTGVVVERDHIWAADRLCGERHAGSVRHIIVKLLMRGCRAVTAGKRN
jgi:hypothetical protein